MKSRFLKFPFIILTVLITFSFFPGFSNACEDCGKQSDNASGGHTSTPVSEFLNSSAISVIAFHSKNCGSCKVQKPRLQGLLKDQKNSSIKGLFLDFSTEKENRKKFKINYPSTILVFKDGVEVARDTGTTSEEGIQALLDKGRL